MTKAATELTATGKDALIATGLGCVTHYSSNDYRSGDTFHIFYGQLGWVGSVCPRIKATPLTQAMRGLQRRGLVAGYGGGGSYMKAMLTEAGQAIFETLITDEHRQAMISEARDEERRRVAEEERKRRQAWDDEHADVFRVFRERTNERSHARHMLQSELTQIAVKLGDGANNVDELLGRLKQIRVEQRRMETEQADDESRLPKYD